MEALEAIRLRRSVRTYTDHLAPQSLKAPRG